MSEMTPEQRAARLWSGCAVNDGPVREEEVVEVIRAAALAMRDRCALHLDAVGENILKQWSRGRWGARGARLLLNSMARDLRALDPDGGA